MLLYKDGNFMQAIEGDEDVVRALHARIALDPRHRGLITLLEGSVPERQFPDWSNGIPKSRRRRCAICPGYSQFLNIPSPTRCSPPIPPGVRAAHQLQAGDVTAGLPLERRMPSRPSAIIRPVSLVDFRECASRSTSALPSRDPTVTRPPGPDLGRGGRFGRQRFRRAAASSPQTPPAACARDDPAGGDRKGRSGFYRTYGGRSG